jgi:general secretion pathway protein D
MRKILLVGIVGLFMIFNPLLLPAIMVDEPEQTQRLKNGSCHFIKQLELKQSKVVDALRIISGLSGVNAVATQEAAQKEVTLFLENVTARDAIDTLCKISGLWYRQDTESGTFRIMTTKEYQRDLIVFREDVTKVFTLLHPNVTTIAQAIKDLFGERVELSFGTDGDELIEGSGFGSSRSSVTARDGARFSQADHDQNHFRRPTGNSSGVVSGKSSRIIAEDLTSDQIAELEQRLGSQEVADQEVSYGVLKGLSRQEAGIYVTVNREHNLILVRTSDLGALEQIEQLIQEVDRPTPQVLLEMKILELSLGNDFKSIFDWEYVQGAKTSGLDSSQSPNPLLTTATQGYRKTFGLGNFDLQDNTFVYQFLDEKVRARIQMLSSENRINLLATPMLLASNNRLARVFVGEERVLTTGVASDVTTPATGATTTTIDTQTEIRDIGTTLEILPKINADRTVTLFIRQDSSSVLRNSATIPIANGGIVQQFPIDTVSTANLEGVVVAKDNLTIAVGGLIRSSVSESLEKVPLLGDLPLFGRLFRKEIKDNDKTEIVLLITPHIIMTPAEGQQKTQSLMEKLSRHPFHEGGESAMDARFRSQKMLRTESDDPANSFDSFD